MELAHRSALAILSVLNPDVIRRAVFNEQADIFCRAQGIGKKTAQKILLHLQDRIPVSGLASPLAGLSDVELGSVGGSDCIRL